MSNFHEFEKRIIEAEEIGIDVYEIDMDGIYKGLYIDNVIAIEKDLSWADKNCVMAEEIGHALYSIGDIRDLSISSNRKQERQARVYAYKHLVPLSKLVEAFECGCTNIYEAAEHLYVTVEFFKEVIFYYYEHYGRSVAAGEYTVYFSQNSVYIQKVYKRNCITGW